MPNRRDFLKRGGASAAAAAVVGPGVLKPGDLNVDGVRHEEDPPRAVALILVDRSGSMGMVREATLRGLNDYLDEQRDKPDLLISLIQFDSAGGYSGLDITETFSFVPAPSAPKLKTTDYQPRGGTPLLAAMADAIRRLEQVVRPQDKALLVVQTDGAENTSPKEITKEVVKNLIASKEAEGNWTFAFMGADIDAFSEASSVGVRAASTVAYASTPASTASTWQLTSTGTSAWYRSNATSTSTFYVDAQTGNLTPLQNVTIKSGDTLKFTTAGGAIDANSIRIEEHE